MSANAFGLIIWTNFVKELKGQDQKAEKKKSYFDYFHLFIVATGCPSERRPQKTVSCYGG